MRRLYLRVKSPFLFEGDAMDSIALREMFPLGPKWGPIGHEVYSRTFSRPQADGSREDWAASIERTVLGNIGLVPKRYIEKGEADKLMELFFQFYSLFWD